MLRLGDFTAYGWITCNGDRNRKMVNGPAARKRSLLYRATTIGYNAMLELRPAGDFPVLYSGIPDWHGDISMLVHLN